MKQSSVGNLSIELAVFESRPKQQSPMDKKHIFVFLIVLALFSCPFSCPVTAQPTEKPDDCHKTDDQNTTSMDCCAGNGIIEKNGVFADFTLSILPLSVEIAGQGISIHQLAAPGPCPGTVHPSRPVVLRI